MGVTSQRFTEYSYKCDRCGNVDLMRDSSIPEGCDPDFNYWEEVSSQALALWRLLWAVFGFFE